MAWPYVPALFYEQQPDAVFFYLLQGTHFPFLPSMSGGCYDMGLDTETTGTDVTYGPTPYSRWMYPIPPIPFLASAATVSLAVELSPFGVVSSARSATAIDTWIHQLSSKITMESIPTSTPTSTCRQVSGRAIGTPLSHPGGHGIDN
jgi:hypothetical protein